MKKKIKPVRTIGTVKSCRGYTTHIMTTGDNPADDFKELRHGILNEQGQAIEAHIEANPELLVLLASAAGLGVGKILLTAEENSDFPGMVEWFVQLYDGKPQAKPSVP